MRQAAALIPCAAVLVALAPVGQALAHGAAAYSATDAGWRMAVAVPVLLAGFAYLRGLRRAWRRAGPGRGVRRTEALAFGAGLAVLALMVALPLHAWGRLRFALHMLEHELLTVLAAPLLAAGRPGVPYLLALPLSWRRLVGRWIVNGGARRLWQPLFSPGVAWALHGAALWLWHAPALFEAALESEAVHYLQHLTLLITALLFWASLLPRRADAKIRVVAVFSLFATSMHSTLLGALLTLSPTVWYASYAGMAGPGGLSALEDQQIAGLITWVPAGLFYLAAALALLGASLRDDGAAPRSAPISPNDGTAAPDARWLRERLQGKRAKETNMPSSPAVGAPSRPFGSVGRSRSASEVQIPCGGVGGPPSLTEQLNEAPASARARGWIGSSVSCLAACLAVLLAADTGAVAQEGEDLETLSRDPGQWVMAPKNYASTRFSELDQINTENVDRLQLAWSFSVGVNRGQEAAPLIVGDTMYVVGPHPNNLFALDATTGDLKWVFSPPTSPAAIGVACCDVVNRGAAYSNGKIFYNTLDNHTVAVDARTGKEVWHTKLGDINLGETMTMAPLVVKGKVLVGNSGGEMGVRGWLTALDENTGQIVWRAYSTGPDEDVLIGEDFEPPYDWMKGEDLGVKTWPPGHWEHGGGTVWGWISYDPELDLIFYGTANPGPWNPNQRPGDNLWTTTIFARDPDTGMARWAYQTTPHDLWDHDGINELLLLELEIDGEMRKVVIRPGRNGYMYVFDRATGRVLSAEPYDTVTAYRGVNLETGRIIPNEQLNPEVGKTVEDVCPAAPGAKDWQPTAWSPRTQLLYVPHQHLCMNFKATEVGYIAGTPYVGAVVDMYAGPGDGYRGEFMAWDLAKQEKVWGIRENFPVWSGTVVTAGDVAFYGTMDRWFKAVDAKTGEVLWMFRAPSGIIGQPVTYEGADGRQYVAILSGVGGWSGAVAAAEIDPRVRNAALGFVGATQDLPAYTLGGSMLLVFALPEAREESAAGPAPAPDADDLIERVEGAAIKIEPDADDAATE